jgi:hypothetical protein
MQAEPRYCVPAGRTRIELGEGIEEPVIDQLAKGFAVDIP